MLRTLSLATLGLVALAAGPALAMEPETLVVHVPFAFSVDDVMLPAGDYRVHPLNDLDRNVVEVRSADGRYGALVLTTDAPAERRGAQPELVFDRYGKKSFLRAVELPGEEGASLSATRSEITAARELASHQHKVPPSAAS
jgi:hypothetical protein